jgi:hypothetical protein
MTASKLADSIEGLIIASNETYAGALVKVQTKLYDDLVEILRFVDVDEQGYIKQNAGNLETHISVIPVIDELNTTYFESISSAFKPNRVFIQQLQAQTIESINSLVLQDGLAAQVKIPLNQILGQNINTGGSMSGMLEQVRTFVKGDSTLDGRILSYSRGIVKDALFQYARAYQNSVTVDLKLEWFRYVGGLIDTSRPFCIERNGHYYTQKEIESWASLEWKGKNPLTTESSIFVLVAGFNCNHQVIPVSESIVPAEEIARSKELGFIN